MKRSLSFFSFILLLTCAHVFAQQGVQHEGETKEGLLVGPHTWYHPNGKKSAIVTYDENGKVLSFKTWTEDGHLMDDEKMNPKREMKGLPDLDWNFTESGLGFVLLPNERLDEPGPLPGDKVSVHYEGFLQDGTIFDSSLGKKKPFKYKYQQGEVIPGFDEAVSMLNVGDSGYFFIPADLGYGEHVVGTIPPYSNLIYMIRLEDLN